MGGHGVSVQRYAARAPGHERQLADPTLLAVDEAIRSVLESQRERASRLLREHRGELEALRDLLLERKVIDSAGLDGVLPKRPSRAPTAGASHG